MKWYTDNTSTPTYTISTAIQLASVAKLVNEGYGDSENPTFPTFAGKTLYISADLDMSAHLWVPIGTAERRFCGVIMTQKSTPIRTISGLRITSAAAGGTGFVGRMEAGVDASNQAAFPAIERLILQGSITLTDPTGNIGGACGTSVAVGRISDVTNELSITVDGENTSANVGGLLGGGSCAVERCVNNASITVGAAAAAGSVNVGGIVGQASGVTLRGVDTAAPVKNAQPITVTAKTAAVGGLVGATAESPLFFSSAAAEYGANNRATLSGILPT